MIFEVPSRRKSSTNFSIHIRLVWPFWSTHVVSFLCGLTHATANVPITVTPEGCWPVPENPIELSHPLNLLCFPDLAPSLEKHDKDANFAVYTNKNFTNYGTDRLAGVDSFTNYSIDENLPVDSVNNKDESASYTNDGNVVDQSLNSYAGGSTSGASDFKKYADSVNVPHLGFNSYSDDSNGRSHGFTGYSENTNADI